MKFRQVSVITLAIALAFAAPGIRADDPAPVPAPAAARAQPAPYIAPSSLDITHVLPPPPAAGSAAERRELDQLLELQASRTPERTELAIADAEINLTRFASVLGPKLNPQALPAVQAFLAKVSRSSGAVIGATKECWLRPRPFVTEPRLDPPGNLKQSTGGNRPRPHPPLPAGSPCVQDGPPSEFSYAYPSGHATWGAMTGILLAEMVPEKRAELFARGWEFGESRAVGGVHYPSDVAAGQTQAMIVVALMMANPEYQKDLAAARAELRAALGYPPL